MILEALKIKYNVDVKLDNGVIYLRKNNNWVVATQQEIDSVKDIVKQLEKEADLKKKYRMLENHILSKYPITKQQSDQADREYFATTLKAKGVANLESDIVARIERFFVGESLEDVVADAQDKEAYLQLIKAGIRVAWVQQCKRELRQAIAEDREPNFPQYPLE